ncbi:MAG: gliding motility lipoprotein GldH [Prevotella sp.]|nr:gliding motility lipoprotein GldH [Prevotella sp.]
MKRRAYTLLYIGAAVLSMAALLTSCEFKTVYDKYQHTPLAGWEKNDTLFFSVPKMPHAGDFRMEVGLRTDESFPFRSISLVIEQRLYPSNIVMTDTIRCELTNQKGYIKGNGVNFYQYKFPLKDIRLNRGDSLQVSIRHAMRRETLPGISDVGFKIKKKPTGQTDLNIV